MASVRRFKTEHGTKGPIFFIKRRMSYKKGPMCIMNWARNLCPCVVISRKLILSVEATALDECLGKEG